MDNNKSCTHGQFQSKKNFVYWDRRVQQNTVTKIFTDRKRFNTEKEIGDILQETELFVPKRLSVNTESLSIVYEYVEGIPVVDIIESADLQKMRDIIGKICGWLIKFYSIMPDKKNRQYILGDIHLRNFLYDEVADKIYGIDFEECRPGRIETDIARLYTFILHYDPEFTSKKKALAACLWETMSASMDLSYTYFRKEVQRETEELQARRKMREVNRNMKTLKIAMLGFGNAGRAFAKILEDKREDIAKKYYCDVKVIAIVTGSKGSLINPNGIDLKKAWTDIENRQHFDETSDEYTVINSIDAANSLDYDVLIELTPLKIFSGQPAIDHIKAALNRKRHAITANKGPIAWSFKELKDLAEKQGVLFYYETTVMDGTPVFNLVDETLKLCKIIEVNGILNSTTNFVIEEMAKGKPYDEVIREGQSRGFVEADPAMDIEGWDAAAKTAALLNVLMDAGITPNDIERKGIEDITFEQIKDAESRGNVIKLLCHGSIENGKVKGRVWPEEISRDNILASINGTSSVVSITTDLMRTVSIVEHDPEIEQTGYGVFSDLLRIIDNIN